MSESSWTHRSRKLLEPQLAEVAHGLIRLKEGQGYPVTLNVKPYDNFIYFRMTYTVPLPPSPRASNPTRRGSILDSP